MSLQYAILIYDTPQDRAIREAAGSEQAEVDAAYRAYTAALIEEGKLVGGEALDLPHTATMVSVREGGPTIQDGPYADTKEQLAGFYVIEAADLDEAIAWAARCPGARTGRVEIRPTTRPS